MVKLLSTLPAQVLEPLCGLDHSHAALRCHSRDRAACPGCRRGSDGCSGGLPPSVRRPHPTGREDGHGYAQRGVLIDSYARESIAFGRGPEICEAVQIEHVVSLSDAWYKGARGWDEQGRRDFANDPHNLFAVGAKANSDKAFRDTNAWLPPNVAFRCEFVARQVAVRTT